jgi:hypothetical protein
MSELTREEARTAIELAIVVIRAFRSHLTEGQVKEIKRIIYSTDEDSSV